RRFTGLTVNINGDEYWYKTSITDGSLILKVSSALSGITGSGTTNKIPMFFNSSGITDSPLSVSGTNVLMSSVDGSFGTNAFGFNNAGDGLMMYLSSVGQANLISS